MATRRTPPVIDSDDEAQPIPGTRIAIEDHPPMNLDLSPGERVVALLEGMGDDEKVSVKLYRQAPNSQSLIWCANYSADDFVTGDFEMVRSEWGPGDYEVRVYGSQGLVSREKVSIAPRINSNPVPQSGANSEVAAMIKALAESQQKMIDTLSHRPDPQAQMMQSIELMRAMREATGISAAPAVAPKSAVESITEMIGAMQAIKTMSAELNPAKDADSSDPMSMLPGIIDLVKAYAPGNRQLSDVPLIAAPQSIAHAAPDAPSQPISDNPAQPIGDQETEEEVQLMQMLMRNYISQVLKMIVAGKSPIEGGRFIYDKLPDAVIGALDSPDWFTQLCAFDSRLTPHEAWLTAAKAEVSRLDSIEDPDHL